MSAVDPGSQVTEPTVPTLPIQMTVRSMPAAAPLKALVSTALTRSGPMLVYQLHKIGRTGAAGAAMLMFAAIFVFSSLVPQQRHLKELEQQIAQARQNGATTESAPVRLNRFMGALPQRAELPKIVGQIFTLAASSGVSLARGKYELTPTRSGHMAQYRMTFPIKGHYPEIRQFIDAVLIAVPAAAVEGLRIERKAIGEDSVSADLRFSVFVRTES